MSDYHTIMAMLADWGAETDQTRERFMNDNDFYMECMRSFLADVEIERLRASLRERSYAAAYDSACALKGVTANLGLIPLYVPSCRIVLCLREKDYSGIAPALNTFDCEMLRLRAILA